MSENENAIKPVHVDFLTLSEEDSLLLQEPTHIVNEILQNTNAFVAGNVEGYGAIIYLGFAQRYALRFLNKPGIIDPMSGTFAGIQVMWVEAPYHVNLVQIRQNAEPKKEG